MRTLLAISSLLFLAGACGDNADTSKPDARNRPRTDASPEQPDAAFDAPPAATGHVLISEVRNNGADEFIELYNPASAAVDLRNYYLSDSPLWWQLPAHAATPVDVANSDWIVRFPAGAMLPPGGVVTIATNGTGFNTAHGAAPSFSIANAPAGAAAMELTVDGGGTASITNTGEVIILFHWNGTTDLVQDVDIVLAGDATFGVGNGLPTAGLRSPVDGPDDGDQATAYAPDALTIEPMPADLPTDAAGITRSYKRIARETAATEAQSGGAGIDGDDETSEKQTMTWDAADTNSTPGMVPTSLSTP